jgi:hypothetical protein
VSDVFRRLRVGTILRDPLVDFVPVDGNVLRSFDADPHLVASDLQYGENDGIVDNDLLFALSG